VSANGKELELEVFAKAVDGREVKLSFPSLSVSVEVS